MSGYYIYVLKLATNDGTEKYYVGKTHQLEKRLQNHVNGNRKSAKALKDTRIVGIQAIEEVYEVCNLDDTCPEADSISSRLENKFVTNKINPNGEYPSKKEKSKYRGGCYLKSWDDDFKLLDLTMGKYEQELKEYKLNLILKKLSVTKDNKTNIGEAVKDNIKNLSVRNKKRKAVLN